MASDDLIQLIASLSRNEKRYVRLYLDNRIGKDASSCTALFDAVSRLAKPDGDALRHAVRNESFAAHLHVTRHHLYHLILKALREYDAGTTWRSKVRELIEGAQALLARGLYEQCRKVLARAREMAEAHELFVEILEIRHIGRFFIGALELEYTPGIWAAERAAFDDNAGRIRSGWAYAELLESLWYLVMIRGKPRSAEERAAFDEVMADPRLRDISLAGSRFERWTYFDCHRVYYVAMGDYQRGHANTLRMIEMIDSGDASDVVDDDDVAIILKAHMLNCIALKRFAEAAELEKRIAGIQGRSSLARARIELTKAQASMMYTFSTGDYAGFVAMEDYFDSLMERYGETHARQDRIVVTFYLAYSHLMLGNPAAALGRLVPLLNTDDELRPEVRMWARLLHIMIHYEQGNVELIPYLWRSLYRALRKRDVRYRFEKILLEFMRGLIDIHRERDLREAFARLRDEIAALSDDPNESDSVMMFSILPWLNLKLAPGTRRLMPAAGARAAAA